MDPITHALSGAVLMNFGFKRRAALMVLILASMAPDIDYATILLGPEVFLTYHRGVTHGVLGLLLGPLVLGYLFRKKCGFLYGFVISVAGYGFHLILDLTNQYGIRLFAPLSPVRYSLDLTFIVEPVIIAIFTLGVVVPLIAKERARTVTLAVMLTLVLYLGVKDHYHARATEYLRQEMQEYIIERVTPMPNDVMRWWFVASGEKGIKLGFADLFTQRIYIHDSLPPMPSSTLVERSKATPVVRGFLDFSRHPYAVLREVKDGSKMVQWKELSYAYAPGEHFTATVVFDKEGRVKSEEFRF